MPTGCYHLLWELLRNCVYHCFKLSPLGLGDFIFHLLCDMAMWSHRKGGTWSTWICQSVYSRERESVCAFVGEISNMSVQINCRTLQIQILIRVMLCWQNGSVIFKTRVQGHRLFSNVQVSFVVYLLSCCQPFSWLTAFCAWMNISGSWGCLEEEEQKIYVSSLLVFLCLINVSHTTYYCQ